MAKNIGVPFKKGEIVRVVGCKDFPDGVYEVERDVVWNNCFSIWGSVKLVGFYPPLFTHKGKISKI